jgi:hypothetical protein
VLCIRVNSDPPWEWPIIFGEFSSNFDLKKLILTYTKDISLKKKGPNSPNIEKIKIKSQNSRLKKQIIPRLQYLASQEYKRILIYHYLHFKNVSNSQNLTKFFFLGDQ